MSDPAAAGPEFASLPMTELSRRRATVAVELEEAEALWLEISERLDQLAA
jgi:ATP-binding cassette subfamily F protein 3